MRPMRGKLSPAQYREAAKRVNELAGERLLPLTLRYPSPRHPRPTFMDMHRFRQTIRRMPEIIKRSKVFDSLKSHGHELALPASVVDRAKKLARYLGPHLPDENAYRLFSASCIYAASMSLAEDLSNPAVLEKMQVDRSTIEERFLINAAELPLPCTPYDLDILDDIMMNGYAMLGIYKEVEREASGFLADIKI